MILTDRVGERLSVGLSLMKVSVKFSVLATGSNLGFPNGVIILTTTPLNYINLHGAWNKTSPVDLGFCPWNGFFSYGLLYWISCLDLISEFFLCRFSIETCIPCDIDFDIKFHPVLNFSLIFIQFLSIFFL